ncbi:MAG: ABC transporter ATP-binding protein [Clostridiales bacterium]|jgi:ATP-binding cassette subfamily B protein|nr:ABC transporter ATP-binding protein [Clostridiales bacterium]
MLKLARYLKYFKKEVTIGPFFKFLEAVFELIVPLVMASIIDIGIKNRDSTYVLQRGGIILLLGFMGLIFAIICQYSAARASQGFGTMVRNDLYKHINTLSHGELDAFGTDTLITILTNDINQMQLAVAMLIRLVVRAPFLVIGAVVMSMILDLRLSLIFLIVAPLVSLVIYIIMKLSVPYYRVRQRMLDRVSRITRENLSGARVIRAFSKQDHEIRRFNEANNDVADIAINVGKISAFLNPATFAILNVAILAILWFGGIRVDLGSLTQGEVIAFVNYMTQISVALVVVANLVVIFTKASASARRINKVFDTMSSVTEKDKIISDIQSTENQINGVIKDRYDEISNEEEPIVSLNKVSFAYPGSDEYALEDISFDINEGEVIGIIGGTGSGKSTLINLLPRFYDVDKGEIKIKGIPLNQYSFDSLRTFFGIVSQKSVLFSGSVSDNLRFSKKDASLDDIKKAIEIAQAKDFVEKLPEGYASQINQGGRNLSGGQRQRITIARALVRNPRILILDDSSSALDYATDARLREAISKNLEDTTVIMVSQRANSIKNADQIIVLDDGKMVGIGKHDELYRTCNIYREICDSQVS